MTVAICCHKDERNVVCWIALVSSSDLRNQRSVCRYYTFFLPFKWKKVSNFYFWTEKVLDISFFEQKKASIFYSSDRRYRYFTSGQKVSVFYFYIDVSRVLYWIFQFWLHYTHLLSLHLVAYQWVFSPRLSCTHQYGNCSGQKINTLTYCLWSGIVKRAATFYFGSVK